MRLGLKKDNLSGCGQPDGMSDLADCMECKMDGVIRRETGGPFGKTDKTIPCEKTGTAPHTGLLVIH